MNRPLKINFDEAVVLYRQGTPLKELGKRYGVSGTAVSALFKRRGVSLRSPSEWSRRLAVNHAAFASITPEAAYWVGLLMADGCVVYGKNEIRLQLSGEDRSHVYTFRDFLDSKHSIQESKPEKWQPRATLALKSKQMADDLSRYGVVPRKTHNAQVSRELAFDSDFWRGVVDGDGNIYYADNLGFWYIRLVGSLQLMTQFLAFAQTCTPTTATVKPHKSISTVHIGSFHAAAVIYALYGHATVALPRKYEIAKELFS